MTIITIDPRAVQLFVDRSCQLELAKTFPFRHVWSLHIIPSSFNLFHDRYTVVFMTVYFPSFS